MQYSPKASAEKTPSVAMFKKMLFFFASILVVAVLLCCIRTRAALFTQYLTTNAGAVEKGDLKVQFLGNTTLLFSDGETSILTDGFFTRPPLLQLLFGKIAPDSAEITRCLRKAGIGRLTAVAVLHSHFDHAMDAPLVAQFTGAKLIGSTSTVNIGRGYNLPDSLMHILQPNLPIHIGNFTLTFVKTAHWPYPNARLRAKLLNNSIEEPLVPPVKMEAYKEGDTYTLLIQHRTTTMAVQGSAGFSRGVLQGLHANILFLGIGGLELMDEAYNRAYQQEVTEMLNPDVLVPIHWDDITIRLDDKPKTVNRLISLLQGINPQKALQQILHRNKNRKITTLPLWKPVPVSQLLQTTP